MMSEKKVGEIYIVESQPEPTRPVLACAHHWHCDHSRHEVVTTGNPKVPAVCCYCGATAHVSAYKNGGTWCGHFAESQPATENQDACCIRPTEKKQPPDHALAAGQIYYMGNSVPRINDGGG